MALHEEALNPPEESDDPATPAPPGRVTSTTQRIIRSSKVAESIKKLHDYTCQICGIRLDTPAGPYAEGAHIKALGTPHNGPDVRENLLCMCPNDHVLFDKGAIYIASEHEIRHTLTDTSLGTLRLKPGHVPNATYIAYHREHFAGQG